MSTASQFLICANLADAQSKDAQVFAQLQAREGANGCGWSGAFTDGTRFAIRWGIPVQSVLGNSGQLETETVDANGVSNWQPYVPPAPPLDETI